MPRGRGDWKEWSRGKFNAGNMEPAPPTEEQFQYLARLEYDGPQPDTRQEASELIDRLKKDCKGASR
jgi:hypothetical protein